jgi:hypothetical protein
MRQHRDEVRPGLCRGALVPDLRETVERLAQDFEPLRACFGGSIEMKLGRRYSIGRSVIEIPPSAASDE